MSPGYEEIQGDPVLKVKCLTHTPSSGPQGTSILKEYGIYGENQIYFLSTLK